MATYNGEKYIKEQLDSILMQLSSDDEVIISDDSSSDSILQVISSYNDDRIKIYEKQKFRSPIFNFENAIQRASGDIIVLSDQDDIWKENKVKIIRESFKNKNQSIKLKMYNGDCINSSGKIIKENLFECINQREGLVNNIIKNTFIGCNIAFTKTLCDIVLPFPKDIPMHDSWLGCCAYIFGEVEFVDKKIFSYRFHENNFTGAKTSFFEKLKWRCRLIKNLLKRYIYVKYLA